MSASSILLPRVTLNLITSPQKQGLQDQRALLVGQLSPGVRAAGTITFSANPSASATITLNGTAWTFVASGATGNQTNIGASLSATLTALATALNASASTEIAKCFYVVSATALFVLHKTPGTGGNSYTLAASAATVSGATLAGGAASTATATAGTLLTDIGRSDGAINTLFGKNSHIAAMGRAFRTVNTITNLDALPLADSASGTVGRAKLVIAGPATQPGTLYVNVVSKFHHSYRVDINSGDTADIILSTLMSAIADDIDQAFTAHSDEASTALFVACNAGPHANDYLLSVDGVVPGVTVTLTGWTGGATIPSLTTLFDPIANKRYQNIVWPGQYTLSKVSSFLDARKNVTNRVMEGRAVVYQNVALATAKTNASAVNSSEVVLLSNVPTADSDYIGPHVPEDGDTLAAKFAAARALRFETGQSLSRVISTNAFNDQFGGIHTASLPYFNTPFVDVGRPKPGTGYTEEDQADAEAGGVAVVGVNDAGNGDITGVIVTTWLNDSAGQPDITWKYLEWRDTHGTVREYIVNNVRKRFEQSRLTAGDINPNYDMANAQMIKGYVVGLCQDLQKQALIQDGQVARQYIEDNCEVTLQLAQRQATVNLRVPIVSQLENLIGSIQIVMDTQTGTL